MASVASERPQPENGSAQDSPARSADAGPGAQARSSVPAGSSVYSPSETPSDSLNPRSCVTCRRRKVKCDKLQPCTNCRRAHIHCVFPAPGRAPRRPRPRDPNAPPTSKHHSSEREVELMKRLRKLEGIVEELSGQIELESTRQNSSSESPEAGVQDAPGAAPASRPLGRGPSISGDRGQEPPLSYAGDSGPPAGVNPDERSSVQHGFGPSRQIRNVNGKFGRMVLHDKGSSRYVSSGFWSKINDEIDALRTATEEWMGTESELSAEDEDTPEYSQGIPGGLSNNAFLFGHHTTDIDLRSFHPLPSQVPFIWQIFDQNVNTLTKILHSPTISLTLNEAHKNLGNLEPPLEALMFAIYLGAVVSMEGQEVQTNFGSDQATLIAKYRYALEIALAKAEFLTSTDLTTFQAFVLYVTLVRRRHDTRYAWTLVGLAVRISYALGLHRDPTNFPGISPFEGEMRRRLFWCLLIMDFRAAEDQGTDLVIVDRSFDTRIPLNINDADFGPDSTELPPARQGETEMTFCLMLESIQVYLRRILNMTSAGGSACPSDVNSPFEKREQLLEDLLKTVDRICPTPTGTAKANPMTFLAATVGRIIHAKMTIIVYQNGLVAACNGKATDALTEERWDRLYTAAIEVFEHGNLLALDPRAKQWTWMLRVFMQWQAAAYLLLRMSKAPWSPMSERAWTALGVTFSSASAAAELDRIADNAAVWLPFRRLYTRARRHRAAEVARLRADKEAARELDLAYSPKVAPSFNNLSNSVRAAMARQSWRKLVDAPPMDDGPQARAQPSTPRQKDQETARARSRQYSLGTGLRDEPQAPASEPGHVQGVGGDASSDATRTPDTFSVGVLDFMGQVMAQPDYAPADFWPVAFPPNNAQSNISPLSAGRANNPSARGLPQHQVQTQPSAATPQFIDSYRKNNAPSWLYPFSDGPPLTGNSRNTDALNMPYLSPSTTTTTTTKEAAGSGEGPFIDFPGDAIASMTSDQSGGQSLDDMDMAMDTDDFNWQTFNENIRGFPSAAGGAPTGFWGI